MNKPVTVTADTGYEPELLPPKAYISPEYARAERDKLWHKVWQQVCRETEIPKVGDFITYEILEDAIIVVRTAPDEIKAFYNVCSHRGRRLIDTPPGAHHATGTRKNFICGFHGWRYNLEGKCTLIPEQKDWKGKVDGDTAALGQIKVDTWGGWVFVNFDENCEPLRQYLEPAASLLDPFQLEKQRCRWRRWVIFDCNWKVALEAFNETYHVETTHPEFMRFGDFRGWGRAQGKHSHIGYDVADDGPKENSTKLRLGTGDARLSTAEMMNYTWDEVNTNTTQTLVDVANRLETDLPEGTPAGEVLKHWLDTSRKIDEDRGVIWPTLTTDELTAAGNSWQIFPNFQIGQALNNALCYSARPYKADPNKCIFEIMVFELFPEGEDPKAEWQYTPADDPAWGSVLVQDFDNMQAVQEGMKNVGFRGNTPNPYREQAVLSLHRNLARYMNAGAPKPIE